MFKGLVSIVAFSLIFVFPLLNLYIFPFLTCYLLYFWEARFRMEFLRLCMVDFNGDPKMMMMIIIHFGNASGKIMGGSEFLIF